MKKDIDISNFSKKYLCRNLPVKQKSTLPIDAYNFFAAFEKYTGEDISTMNIFDLGCSNGNFMCIANELGAKGVYGIEIEREYVNKSKKLLEQNCFQPNVVRGNYYDLMREITFPDGMKVFDMDLFHLYAYAVSMIIGN